LFIVLEESALLAADVPSFPQAVNRKAQQPKATE
jgi:hypothetical protein